jgi:hypothetical protein
MPRSLSTNRTLRCVLVSVAPAYAFVLYNKNNNKIITTRIIRIIIIIIIIIWMAVCGRGCHRLGGDAMLLNEEAESRPTFPESRPTFPESRPTFPESRPTFPESRPTLPEALWRRALPRPSEHCAWMSDNSACDQPSVVIIQTNN